MATEQQKIKVEQQVELLQAVNEKISLQRNTAHNRIAHLELILDSKEKQIRKLKAELEGEKLFKEKNKKDK